MDYISFSLYFETLSSHVPTCRILLTSNVLESDSSRRSCLEPPEDQLISFLLVSEVGYATVMFDLTGFLALRTVGAVP